MRKDLPTAAQVGNLVPKSLFVSKFWLNHPLDQSRENNIITTVLHCFLTAVKVELVSDAELAISDHMKTEIVHCHHTLPKD